MIGTENRKLSEDLILSQIYRTFIIVRVNYINITEQFIPNKTIWFFQTRNDISLNVAWTQHECLTVRQCQLVMKHDYEDKLCATVSRKT